jgi:hypothetical protein
MKIRKRLKVLLPMFMQHIKINSKFKGTHNKLKTVAGFVIFLNGISVLGLASTNLVTFLIKV